MNLRSSLFRGATKPTLILGVPLTAVVAVTMPIFLLGMVISWIIGLAGYLTWLIPVVFLPIFRELTKRDDQYLRMLGLELQEKIQLYKNKKSENIYVVPPRKIRLLE